MNKIDVKIQIDKEKSKEEKEKKAQEIKRKKKLMYDPYGMPAQKKFAELHEKATRFARPDKLDAKMFRNNMCPCCMLPTRNTPLNCCGSSLAEIGKTSRTLKHYFQILIFLIVVFSLIFFLGSVPHLVFNPDIATCILSSCTDEDRERNMNAYFQSVHKANSTSFSEQQFGIMCLTMVIVIFVCKYIFFFYLFRQYKKHDVKKKTPGDYTVHAHNFNNSSKKSELVFAICDFLKDDDIMIKDGKTKIKLSENYIAEISRIHNIHNLTELTSKYINKIKEKKILNRKGNYDSAKMTKIEDKISKYKQEIKRINKEDKKANYTGEAFVTFSSLEIPGQIINNEWKVIWKKYFSKKPYFLKAPEPSDVIWSNFGISPWNRLARIFLSYFFAAFLILVSFVAILGVKVAQENSNLEEEENKLKMYAYMIMIIGVIVVINFILRKILILVSIIEQRKFFSLLESSKIFKVSLALFLNTGIIILITSFTIIDQDKIHQLFHSKGIVINVQMLMLISLSTPILWSLLNPFHFLRFLSRKIMENKLKNKKNQVLQLEANAAFERNNFELDFKYYSIFKTITIALFYQPVVPYGPILAVIELVLWFLCDKYVLINRCAKPQELDFSFTLNMLSYFDIFLILLPLGNAVFITQVFGGQNNPLLIAALVLTFMEAFIIRINVLFKCCKCCYTFDEKDVDYHKVKYQFRSYRQENPLTSILYKYDKQKKKMVSNRDLDKPGEEPDDDINLLNIINLIGMQQGRAFGGNNRVFVQDEAFVFNDLQAPQGAYNRGQTYTDYQNNYFDNYEALLINRGANAYMQYNQNYFDNPQDNQGYYYQNTYNQQGAQNQANYAPANYFDNVIGQFVHPLDQQYQGNVNPNSVPVNTDQPYGQNPTYANPGQVNPNPTYVQPSPNPAPTDQQFFPGQNNANHYGGPPPQGGLVDNQNPNYNHYGGTQPQQNAPYNGYGNGQPQGDVNYNPYGNAYGNNNQNQYDNNQPGNYFDNQRYSNNNNPYGNGGANPYGYGGNYR